MVRRIAFANGLRYALRKHLTSRFRRSFQVQYLVTIRNFLVYKYKAQNESISCFKEIQKPVMPFSHHFLWTTPKRPTSCCNVSLLNKNIFWFQLDINRSMWVIHLNERTFLFHLHTSVEPLWYLQFLILLAILGWLRVISRCRLFN